MTGLTNVIASLGGAAAAFPYEFVAVRRDGTVNVSDDGISWAANGGAAGPNGNWQYGAFSPALGRIVITASTGHAAGQIMTSFTDDGDNWTQQGSVASGGSVGAPVRTVWTDLWGGRFYCQVRQSGATLGDIFYSDDGGNTWTAVTWPVAKVTNWDIEYMAIGPDRLVCAGRFLGDGNTTKRIFYTTDGENMVAGPTGITSSGLSQSGDGLPRGCAYVDGAGAFVFIGATGSNFILPAYFTSVNGTAVNSGPTNLPGTGSSRSSDLLWIGSFSLAVGPFSLPGVAPGTIFVRSADGSAWSALTVTAFGSDPRLTQVAHHSVLNRAVAACNAAGAAFLHSTDGVSWTSAAGSIAASWNSVIATG